MIALWDIVFGSYPVAVANPSHDQYRSLSTPHSTTSQSLGMHLSPLTRHSNLRAIARTQRP